MSELKRRFMQGVLAAGLIASATVAGAATEDDRLLASQCLGCHAADPNGAGGFDRLNGESAAEIVDELNEMRGATKELDIMHMQARGYTDDQIQRLAHWFAAYAPRSATPGPTPPGGSTVTPKKTEDSKDRSSKPEVKVADRKVVSKTAAKKPAAKKKTVRKSS